VLLLTKSCDCHHTVSAALPRIITSSAGETRDKKVYSIPATRFAEELGKRMVLNSVMVGFFTAITKLLGADSVRRAVADSVPAASRELNLKAFDKGLEYGNGTPVGTPARAELEALALAEE
jgi:Pyruvate/2-oxoacid:ferredoxin oxidoreductase gamma subunit